MCHMEYAPNVDYRKTWQHCNEAPNKRMSVETVKPSDVIPQFSSLLLVADGVNVPHRKENWLYALVS